MRFVSWNVNGLRACVQKGFLDFFHNTNADFFCLQETKLQEGQIELDLPGYEQYWCYAEKKGYSGTAIFTKHTPLSIQYGIGVPELDTEGRAITLEYPEFYLVTCYTPNAQRGLARIEHRLQWETAFRNYLTELDSKKSVIICGDLNVAHKEIDLKNPASNKGNAGFSDEERTAFSELLDSGFTDTFRHLHPTDTGCYTWWSYMFNARQNNAGWRIDYFLVSDRLQDAIYRTPIHSDVLGSDHCPIELDLDITCNGGIWSSSENSGVAEASVRTEEKANKSSGVKAAALLSAALVLLAGILFFRDVDLPITPPANAPTASAPMVIVPPPGTDFFSCITLQSELQPILKRYPPGSSQFFVSGFSAENGITWETDATTQYDPQKFPPCGLNFWVCIAPDLPEIRKECRISAQFINADSASSASSGYPATVHFTRYFDNRGEFSGWFLFGYAPWDMTMQVSLWDENGNLLKRTPITVSPILTENDAMQMSTDELLDFALNWQGFLSLPYSPYPSLPSTVLLPPDNYRSCWNTQPALKVLTYRSDFHDRLETRNAGNSAPGAQILQGLDVYLQEICRKYGTYPTWEEATATSTDVLVRYICQHEGFLRYMTEDLISSTYPSVSSSFISSYYNAKLFNPVLEILEKREDALDELLQQLDSSYVAKLLLDQPEFIKHATASQAERYLNAVYDNNWRNVISTEDLLLFIMNLDRVWLSVNASAPYKLLVQSFSCVKELENRNDTIDILLSYISEIVYDGTYGGTNNRKVFANYLLKQDVYFNRMTEEQKQLYYKHYPLGPSTPTVDPSAPQPRIQADLYSGTALPVTVG